MVFSIALNRPGYIWGLCSLFGNGITTNVECQGLDWCVVRMYLYGFQISICCLRPFEPIGVFPRSVLPIHVWKMLMNQCCITRTYHQNSGITQTFIRSWYSKSHIVHATAQGLRYVCNWDNTNQYINSIIHLFSITMNCNNKNRHRPYKMDTHRCNKSSNCMALGMTSIAL